MLNRKAAAVISVFAGAVYLLHLPQAWADEGHTDVDSCESAWICAIVEMPGGGSGDTAGGGDRQPSGEGAVQDGKTCATGATEIPTRPGWDCRIRDVGTWSEYYGCWVRALDPQPSKSEPIWGGRTDGAIYHFVCLAENASAPTGGGMWWRETNPLDEVGPSAAAVAQQALSRMRLDGASIGSAPHAGSEGLVGMPVWLWTEQTPNTWGPISTTASAGGLSVTATASVKHITWAMGDGNSVTCTEPGTPYEQSYGKRESPDCGHTYSAVPGAGSYTITATSTWEITWAATNGESGTLPAETRVAETAIRIGELQVVN
ncbi:ATP-binding protein [Streptomyces xiamenensis]|uniref:ATP-binding protein n=1 Tax=Streptomyces xiamenensis TaxID=408015 RepID=UPI0036E3ACB4